MKTNSNVGLWIDHKKAIIVTVSDKGVELNQTISAVEKQTRRTGTAPLKGKFDDFQVPDTNARKRTFLQHLNVYYDAVIANLAQADNIVICGPGEAKNELKKRLKKNHLEERVAAVKTMDKMTDRQLAVWVQKYFAA
jgi:stalled ribosome rescue protein Dom34